MDTISSLATTYVNKINSFLGSFFDHFSLLWARGMNFSVRLNSYTQMAIKEINSQVNEQANAGLQ